MNEVLGQWLLVENHLLRAQEGIIRRNASLHTSVAMPCIVRQLPFFRRVFHELETQYPFFTGGWAIANEGEKLPPECYWPIYAKQLCAAAKRQGLSAMFENGPDAMGSPPMLTISWPDTS